ncbi:unnamed protein product [Coregonus sp. 'balchen']|nr:unnamed protein product [Coregonus sp. 'balchen']
MFSWHRGAQKLEASLHNPSHSQSPSLRRKLSPSQPVPNCLQIGQAQRIFSLRPGIQPGTNNIVANQKEGPPDGDDCSRRFPSSSVPKKTVHYRNYPSNLGSPIVPRTWGASGTFQSVKNTVIQSSHVDPSSLQPVRDRFVSPVIEHTPIPAQQAENPVRNNDKPKYRKVLSSYLFRGIPTHF